LDKTIIGLVGAASALALAGGAQSASASPLPPAQSFAELLDPIPDAVSRLRTQNGDGDLSATADERPVQLAQYHHHHHHHHHHHWWWHRHCHHHHHHHYY